MAYPTIDKPYGLKPVNLIGGRVYSGSTRMIPIAQSYNYNFFNGDVVKLAGGTLAPTAMGGSASVDAGTIGVFVGAEYSNANGPIYGKNRWQYWAAGTNTQDAIGYVVDDPQACFRVAVLTQAQNATAGTLSNTPGLGIGYMSPAFLGTNAVLVTNGSNGGSASGIAATGDSVMGVTGTNPTAGANAGNLRYATATPFRIIQLVPDTAVVVAVNSGTAVSSSATVTVASATGIQPGMQLICTASGASGAQPSDFCTVVGVSSTTITVQSRTSATNGAYTTGSITIPATSALTFVGYPEVIVGWNFGYHSYMYATGV
jgi:hypothetical protein